MSHNNNSIGQHPQHHSHVPSHSQPLPPQHQHLGHNAHHHQQPHSPESLLPRTASTSSTVHNLLLEEFADDFDVSLSGLCLGPADQNVSLSGPGLQAPLPLMNTVFGSLADIVKVEEVDFNLDNNHHSSGGNLGGHGGGHSHMTSQHHSPPEGSGGKEKKHGGSSSGPGTPVGGGTGQHVLLGHMDRGGSFDAHDSFYGTLTNDTEDSCQSDTYSSSDNASSSRAAPKIPVLQTVLENLMQQQQQNEADGSGKTTGSKRLCFKGLVEMSNSDKDDSSLSMGPPQMTAPTSAAAAAAAAALTLNPLSIQDMSGAAAAGADPFFGQHPLNVANAYGYAWRRWSKTDAPPVKNNKSGSIQPPHTMAKMDDTESREFQYILGAPTAAGTKLGHMTMTYLNQGQSYEIRLKKLRKVPNEANLKTCVRLGFVEKRLQYRENEEMANWSMLHAKDRLLDIDFTMSYGVFDVNLHSTYNHSINFVWNPGREASIFIKINCISTEFTSKRHGGERGAPLRLIVETFGSSEEDGILDAGSCLIKVFKSKGAERKHKTDRDRMTKMPDAELHYQPSYDCTLLTAYKEEPLVPPTASGGAGSTSLDTIAASPSATPPMSSGTPGPSGISSGSPTPGGHHRDSPSLLSSTHSHHRTSQDSGYMTPGHQKVTSDLGQPHLGHGHGHQQQHHSISSPISTTHDSALAASSSTMTPTPSTPNSCTQLPQSTSHIEENPFFLSSSVSGTLGMSAGKSGSTSSITSSTTLPANAGAIETYEWLKRNRFFRLAESLCDYTADDLRRLSRDDLIQLCDLKDGIRLFNLIHTPEGPATKLTIFITVDGSEHYALYFKSLCIEEFRDKLSETFADSSSQLKLRHLHMIGPNGIRVKLTNNVIANMKNESVYVCVLSKVDDEYDVALRLSSQ